LTGFDNTGTLETMQLILFGAGNIGRSFIAPVFAAGGYEVVFVDISEVLVEALNRRGRYDVELIGADGVRTRNVVEGVSAISALDESAVAECLVTADLAATAVGLAGFKPVFRLVAAGLARRAAIRPNKPLDIILAENIPDAALTARLIIRETEGTAVCGLVETSIGKMVPIMPSNVVAEDPLLVYAEPYNTLIVDRRGFTGAVPEVPNLRAVDDIRAYVHRKLFVHNLGHAAVAYLGFATAPDQTKVAGAVRLPELREAARAAMQQSADGLYGAYRAVFEPGSLETHIEDLLFRFENEALGDTVFRVGRDLRRKLARDDRVVGAMRLLAGLGLPMHRIADVYAAALGFQAAGEDGKQHPGDSETIRMYEDLGLDSFMEAVSGLESGRDDVVIASIREAVERAS